MPFDLTLDRQIHDEILALLSKANARPKYYRNPARSISPAVVSQGAGVHPRDEVVNACVNRAAASKVAIVSLIDLGLADDAMTLARALLELSVNTAWMLSGNWPLRLDNYCASYETYRKHVAEAAPFHYDEQPEIQAAAVKWQASPNAKVAAPFADANWPWAIGDDGSVLGIRAMLKELIRREKPVQPEEAEKPDSAAKAKPATQAKKGKKPKEYSTFLYDIVYGELSAFAHPNPHSIVHIVAGLRARRSGTFDLRPATPADYHFKRALFLSNGSMLMLLHYFNVWCAARLDDDIELIRQKMQSAKSPPQPGAEGALDV